MMFEAEFYPPQWQAMRRDKLAHANYCCEECGVKHLSIRQNTRTGADYIVYLSIAHRQQYQTWRRDADTMVLCQRCHRRYDRQFRRKGGLRSFTPVGYAALSVDEGKPFLTCVGHARTWDDLRGMVAALPDDTPFEVQLVINTAIVGNGQYHKDADGITIG